MWKKTTNESISSPINSSNLKKNIKNNNHYLNYFLIKIVQFVYEIAIKLVSLKDLLFAKYNKHDI